MWTLLHGLQLKRMACLCFHLYSLHSVASWMHVQMSHVDYPAGSEAYFSENFNILISEQCDCILCPFSSIFFSCGILLSERLSALFIVILCHFYPGNRIIILILKQCSLKRLVFELRAAELEIPCSSFHIGHPSLSLPFHSLSRVLLITWRLQQVP